MQLPLRLIPAVLVVASATPAFAQGDAPLQRARSIVPGVPLQQSVNPLTRDISTVFGDARNILDTPRAVSSITEALLNERGIHGVKEFIVYTPGGYASSSY